MLSSEQRLVVADFLKSAAISLSGGRGILRQLKAKGVPVFRKPGFEGAPEGYWGATSFVDRATLTNGKSLDYVYIPRGVQQPLDDLAHEAGHIFQPDRFRPRIGTHGRERLLSEVSANEEAVRRLPAKDHHPYLRSVAPDYRTYKVTESVTDPVRRAGGKVAQRFDRIITQLQRRRPDVWADWQRDNGAALPFNKAVRRNLERTETAFARQYQKFTERNRDLLQREA